MIKAAWTLAIETLRWIELERLGERLALAKAMKQLGEQNSSIIGLAYKLVSETIRRKNFIDFIVNSVMAPRSISILEPRLRAFLRLYVYETQILNSDFEQAVKIARLGRSILGWRNLHANEEVLGKILGIEPSTMLHGIDDEKRVGLVTYHPTWFVKYCFRHFGRKTALDFLWNSLEIPPTYLRLNTLKASKETLLNRITNDDIVLEKVPQIKNTYQVVKTAIPLTRTTSFQKGLFYIQDKASCLATEIANPPVDSTILDVCAAPGAKTTHLAQLMDNQGVIYSVDYSRRRMQVWKREIKRMGITIATPLIADARSHISLVPSVDLVLVDPPCTSTGSFAKDPSTKWRLTKKSITRMMTLQWKILNHCATYVKDHGFIVYSTCSITVQENEMVIEKFLRRNPEFKLVDTSPRIGSPGLRGQDQCQRLYPHTHQCNGFFIAKLIKETS